MQIFAVVPKKNKDYNKSDVSIVELFIEPKGKYLLSYIVHTFKDIKMCFIGNVRNNHNC